ncbi:MAG: hypothetical protein PHP25_00730 [Candidatus Moranbacteria bacterium]|nr:hypothetical protein [Candidatus Moranbacteria bacterium]
MALRNPASRERREEKAELWKIMSSKIIIIATIILLIVSFSVLFVVEAKNHNYDYKKAWSVVYFENPRDDSLNFAIENHEGKKMAYDYNIFIDGKKVSGNKVEIEKGAEQRIVPVLDLDTSNGVSVSIEVSADDLKYKIYKNLGK